MFYYYSACPNLAQCHFKSGYRSILFWSFPSVWTFEQITKITFEDCGRRFFDRRSKILRPDEESSTAIFDRTKILRPQSSIHFSWNRHTDGKIQMRSIFWGVCLFVKCFGNPHSGESEVHIYYWLKNYHHGKIMFLPKCFAAILLQYVLLYTPASIQQLLLILESFQVGYIPTRNFFY